MLHAHAQDQLEHPSLGQLDLLEHHDFGRVVGVAQVAADPKHPGLRHQVQQHLQPVVGGFFGLAAAQLLPGDHAFLVLDHVLAAEVEMFDVEGAVGRLAMFAGHLVLPAGAVLAAVELLELRCAFLVPGWTQPGGPAEDLKLGRAGEPVVGGIAQPVGRRVDAKPPASFQTLAQGFPGPLGEPSALVHPDAVHVQRPEGVAVGARRTEVEDRAVGELQPEIGFAVDLGLAVLGQRDARHQVRIGVELEFELLNQRVEMALMRCADETLAAPMGEGEMQGVGADADALADVESIQVDDVAHRAPQVVDLMRPVEPSSTVPVAQIGLAPEHRVAQGPGYFTFSGGDLSHSGQPR